MSKLFEPFKLKGLELKNRIVLSPMCQYKAENQKGIPENWHFVHLVSRAIGGTGLIMTEMTNVESRGRITEGCLGLYNDQQKDAFKWINDEIHRYDAKTAIQIAHAGRKSQLTNETIVAPSAIPFSQESTVPKELKVSEIESIVEKFGQSARRAVEAGFDTIELHGAHGYLLHQFISRASNKRTDKYGDPTLFSEQVIRAMKSEMPSSMPLIMRVSAIEYTETPYSLEEMLDYCRTFAAAGVDAFDVSTGGNSLNKPLVYPGYQAKYAKAVKTELGVPVISVGALEDPKIAEHVLNENEADLIAIGKGMLKDPHWAKSAALQLGDEFEMPGVYGLGY